MIKKDIFGKELKERDIVIAVYNGKNHLQNNFTFGVIKSIRTDPVTVSINPINIEDPTVVTDKIVNLRSEKYIYIILNEISEAKSIVLESILSR